MHLASERATVRKEDYEGTYRIKCTPRRMKSHNATSWKKIERAMAQGGGSADFNALAIVVKDHRHGGKSPRHPYQFITYCIRQGWLERQEG
jgi:hypothetical protein